MHVGTRATCGGEAMTMTTTTAARGAQAAGEVSPIYARDEPPTATVAVPRKKMAFLLALET